MGNDVSTLREVGWPMNEMNMNRKLSTNQDDEMEKEKLKEQLIASDMYDKGMNVEEMRTCVEAINESKISAIDANIYPANTPGPSSDIVEPLSSPSSFQNDNRKISTPLTKTNDRELSNLESSHELHEHKRSQSTDCNSSEESIFSPSKSPVNTNAADAAHTRGIEESTHSQDSNSIGGTNINRNQNSREAKSYRISYKKVNVWNCKTLPNDVPLKTRCIIRPSKKIDIVDGISNIPDEILAEKRAYLTEMTNLAHSWKTQLVCNEYSWGPPIKVGIANGSLDKHPIHEEIPDEPATLPVHQSHAIMRDMGATPYSLRSVVKTKNDIYDFPDSDDDFVAKNKRKKIPKVLLNKLDIPRQYQPETNQNHEASEEITKSVGNSMIDVADNDVEEVKSISNGRKRVKPMTPDPQKASYPRRITPPVLSAGPNTKRKKPLSASRSKKRSVSPEYNSDENKPTNKTCGLSENQIQHLLTEDEEPVILDIPVQLSKRLNQSIEHLKKLRLKKEENKQWIENEKKLLFEGEARAKIERAMQRIEEREAKLQQLATRAKYKKDCENRYRNLTNISRSKGHITGTFQKRTELESDELPPRSIYYTPSAAGTEILSTSPAEERDMFADEEFKRMESDNSVQQSECPICRKRFSLTEIENHAANCDDFAQDKSGEDDRININASTSNNSSVPPTFSCKICEFVTHDKNISLKHFSDCINSLTNEGNQSTKMSSNQSNNKLTLSTRDSDEDIDSAESSLPLTDKKPTQKPQNRKRKR